jgi:signal transduction histidine kinase
VLPTIAPDMDYAELEGIREGTEASAAYLEAIDPGTSQQRREALRDSLLKYCRHDTEAMVRLVGYFARS